jgi:hypothetical protein
MLFMNEGEIDQSVEVISERAPEFARFAKYLSDWRDVVNSSSDGWPYWKAGARSAERLMGLLNKVMDVLRGRGGEMPTEQEFRKSLAPIKALATKHKLKAPELEDAPAPGFAP